MGISTVGDCNDPEASPYGYFPIENAINKNGERVSALTTYLDEDIARDQINRLSVCTGTVASRLRMAGDEKSEHTVTGVYVRPSTGSRPAKDCLVKARREVILTC